MSQTLLLVLCAGVPGLWAQRTVKRTFDRYSRISTERGLTGAQAAHAVLRESGLSGVSIRPVGGWASRR